jgi:hypothetical protein
MPVVRCPAHCVSAERLPVLQKNLREMLNPRYQSLLLAPPRAIWAIVDPNEFEKFSWKW